MSDRDHKGRFAPGNKGGGRRSRYSEPLAKAICKMLAGGMTLNQVCGRSRMPAKATVLAWATDLEHPFSDRYVRAREIGYSAMADEIVDISDDGTNDWMERENKDGSTTTVVDHEHISRSKLRVDTRKWLLSKALPKIYGDKVAAEITGKDGGPIETKDVSDIEAAQRVAYMLGQAMERQRKEKNAVAQT